MMQTTATTPISPVISKIKKLLELSRSGDENEAALAAVRARELMAKYEIEDAALRVEEGKRSEPITEQSIDSSTKKKVAWKGTIASGLAAAFGAKMFWWGASIRIFGRESAIQAISYMFTYLTKEVDRLADRAHDAANPHHAQRRFDYETDQYVVASVPESARAWKNAFRVGAAHAIAERLREQARKERNQRHAAAVASDLFPQDAASAPSQALVLLDREAEEVEEAYQKKSKGWGRASIGQTSSRGGYGAGQAAGRRVHLSGGRGLKAPPAQVRGRQ